MKLFGKTSANKIIPVLVDDDGHVQVKVQSGGGGMKYASGEYVGDNNENRSITGLGFAPKILSINRKVTNKSISIRYFKTNDIMIDNLAAGMSVFEGDGLDNITVENRINSLDADGFTIGDAGTGGDPNTQGINYEWQAWG